MKKVLKILGFSIGGIIIIAILVFIFFKVKWYLSSTSNLALLGKEAPTLTTDSFTYRDLNKNGKLDVYEDSRRSVEERVEDILQQMTIEEKAGLMFNTIIGIAQSGTLLESPDLSNLLTFMFDQNSELIAKKKITHFNILQSPSAINIVKWHNKIQKLAERTRLGIPITISSDPRHGSTNTVGSTIYTPFFSRWCSPLGFATIGDENIVREFGDIARQEYKAIGIRLALHPMADLATEPRWARISGTFGEDAQLSAKLTKAYILGFQGEQLNANSVACMTKHFPGGGPQKDGEDAHFPYGAEQVYKGNNFNYHLIPFEQGAFPAHTAQIMPYYGVPVDQTNENVGFGYNKEIITGLLREKYKFKGVVCTDWGLVSSSFFKPAAAHGVEELTEIERVKKIIDAGCDMLGGEKSPEWIIQLVKEGKIKESRIDKSVRRILRDKFILGLFDNPYLEELNLNVVGKKEFVEKGKEAQRKSLVLLKNADNLLPLKKGMKIYAEGVEKSVLEKFASVVNTPEEADVIILHLSTPYEPRNKYFLETFSHQGSLEFSKEKKEHIINLCKTKPTAIVFSMDRPPVIPDINTSTKALIADFGSAPEIHLELLFGEYSPSGRLPFEIPSSMEAVKKQKEDTPYDSEAPLYPFGFGLSYTLTDH